MMAGRANGRKGYESVVYRCKDFAPSCNAAGYVCHEHQYAETKVVAFVADMVDRLENEPEFVEAAMLKFLQMQRQADATADLEQISRELTAITARETATARAKVEAIAQGQSTAVYDQFLKEINAERTRLEARKRIIEETLAHTPTEDPKESAQSAKRLAQAMREVLTSESLYAWKKNAAFSRIVQEIRPVGNSFRLVLRPFKIGSHAVPVAFGEPSIR